MMPRLRRPRWRFPGRRDPSEDDGKFAWDGIQLREATPAERAAAGLPPAGDERGTERDADAASGDRFHDEGDQDEQDYAGG